MAHFYTLVALPFSLASLAMVAAHSIIRFNQPAQKKARRQKRAAKAAAVAPRPTGGLLRPAVHCPTIKYASKVRLGRGFSAEELKGAGIPVKLARSIGIAVDTRRVNKSFDSLATNVARLKEFQAKLVLFPKKKLASPGKGEASVAEQAAATQFTGTVLPLTKATPSYPIEKVVPGMAYSDLRKARTAAKMVGIRDKMAKEKAAAEKEAKEKK